MSIQQSHKVIKVVFKDIFGFAGAEFFMWPSLLDVALLPVCLSIRLSVLKSHN